MANNTNISHAEMWDDSALVHSWNDALEEYKKYHSIKVTGEDEEEVLKAAEVENPLNGSVLSEKGSGINDQQAKTTSLEKTADNDIAQSNTMHSAPTQTSDGAPAVPQHLIGQIHDEGLKNLLMSWYYAGYYTGLYEGQKGTDAKHEA